jgi:hypothetical protein
VAAVQHHGAHVECVEASKEEAKESFISTKPCRDGIRLTAHHTWVVRRMRGDTVNWSGRKLTMQ